MDKKRTGLILKLLFSALALGIIFSQIRVQALAGVFSSANIALIGAGLALAVLQQAVNAWKIVLLLPGAKIDFSYVLFTNFAANFFRLVVPTDLGAELGRGYYISRKTGSAAAVFSAIVLDRYQGFLAQVAVMGGAALLWGEAVWAGIGAAALLCALVLAAAQMLLFRIPGLPQPRLLWLARITAAAIKVSTALREFRGRKLRVAGVTAVSILCQCLVVLMIVAVSRAYHEPLLFREAAVISLLVSIGFILPVSLAGLGIVEGIFAGMFGYFMHHQETGLAVSLSLRAMAVILALPGVFFIVFEDRLLKKGLHA